MKTTVSTLKKQKENGEKITMLTCYDYSMAKLMDEAGIEILLIGDSLGNTMLGYENTLPVTMEDMIAHTAAVSRGAKKEFVLEEMPNMSNHTTLYDSDLKAGRLIKDRHEHGVKLEGGARVCPQIEAIVAADIPVCAHIGLTPQSINAFGGFKVQGKSEEAARQLVEDAKKVEAAGASLLVMECVPAKLAEVITKTVSIPTIGIGAGAGCDGQVLVNQDMLGMFSDFTPKFVKRFANVGEIMKQAFADYSAEVKAGTFPAPEHTYAISDEVIDKLY